MSAKEQGENENNVPKFVIPCIAIYECNDSNESIEKEQIIEDQVEVTILKNIQFNSIFLE